MADPQAIAPRPAQTTSTTQVTAYSYQGILPPPEMLARFNEIVPNGADRIVSMAESQQRHRQGLEAAVVNGNVTAQGRGQLLGFTLGAMGILGGIFLISQDKSVEGLTSIIVAVTGLVSVFIYARYEQAKERERKRREAKEAARQPRLSGLDD